MRLLKFFFLVQKFFKKIGEYFFSFCPKKNVLYSNFFNGSESSVISTNVSCTKSSIWVGIIGEKPRFIVLVCIKKITLISAKDTVQTQEIIITSFWFFDVNFLIIKEYLYFFIKTELLFPHHKHKFWNCLWM